MLASALQSVRNFDRRSISRYLLTLVALLAMTTGAWADKGTLLVTINSSENTDFKSGSKTFDNVAKVTLSGQVEYDGGWYSYYPYSPVTVTVSAANDDVTITSVKFFTTLGDVEDKTEPYEAQLKKNEYMIPGTDQIGYYYQVYVNGSIIGAENAYNYLTKIEVYGTKKESAPEVIISDDQTSAEFDMPSYDATLEYQIVRNLASNTTLNLFIGTDPVTADARLRIKKDGSAYIPVSALSFTLTDAPEGGQTTTLTAAQALAAKLNPVYELKGEGEDQWTIVAINPETHLPATLAPGQTYRVSLVAADDAPLYGGEVQAQYLVTLFEGYEVTVPAGEYITYYRDEPLMVDKTQQPYAELYTISEVGTETATLSGPYDAMKTLTPMLVFNSSDDAQTILLIPTTEPDLAVTVAPEFKGTLEATQIAASDATTNNYAFNGNQFVWVKTAIAVGQYKAWLEVPVSTSNVKARAISLVFEDGTTKITNTNITNLTNGDWYDLNGRKLNGIPTKKGVYIMNGKKVVVK